MSIKKETLASSKQTKDSNNPLEDVNTGNSPTHTTNIEHNVKKIDKEKLPK